MAIAKLSFTKLKGGAKASLRYYVHRHEERGERITRTIFDRDGKISKYEAYRMIDKAAFGTTFFRLIISPDQKTEDIGNRLNMREVTEQTMQSLKRILGTKEAIEYLGIEHTNTNNRHVHAMFFVKGKISKEQLRLIRKSATAASKSKEENRQEGRGERSIYPGIGQKRTFPISRYSPDLPEQSRPQQPYKDKLTQRARGGGGGGKAPRICPNCKGATLVSVGRFLQCASCGMAVGKPRRVSLESVRHNGLELSL